jgi:hypothetical protein
MKAIPSQGRVGYIFIAIS